MAVKRQPEGRERIVIQRVAMTEDSPPNRIGRAALLFVGPVFRPAARGSNLRDRA
jgi:hypothetical protein